MTVFSSFFILECKYIPFPFFIEVFVKKKMGEIQGFSILHIITFILSTPVGVQALHLDLLVFGVSVTIFSSRGSILSIRGGSISYIETLFKKFGRGVLQKLSIRLVFVI